MQVRGFSRVCQLNHSSASNTFDTTPILQQSHSHIANCAIERSLACPGDPTALLPFGMPVKRLAGPSDKCVMKALAQTSATDSPTERHSEPSSHRWKCILLSLPGSKELGGAPKRSWRPGCSERNSHKVFDLTKRKVMF